MNATQVKSARLLYDKEVKKLVDVNMVMANVLGVNENDCTASKIVCQPVIAEGHEETKKHELMFEEHYQGTQPNGIVGIEFSDQVMEDGLMLWEIVLRKLAKELLLERSIANRTSDDAATKV